MARADLAFDADIHACDLAVHPRAIRRHHPRALTWVHTSPPCAEPRTTTIVKTQTEIAGGARVLHACVQMRYSRTSSSTRWLLQTLPIAFLEDVKEASCGATAARFCRRTGDNLQPSGGRIRSGSGWRGCGRIAWRWRPGHRGPVAKRTAPAKSRSKRTYGRCALLLAGRRSTGQKYSTRKTHAAPAKSARGQAAGNNNAQLGQAARQADYVLDEEDDVGVCRTRADGGC
jgi:hypothetical protein